MTKPTRAQHVQTPGVDPLPPVDPETDATPQEPTTSDTEADPLPPDVQAMIDQRVEQKLAQERKAERRARMNPVTQNDDLPTQEEALARVQKDPKRRAILSRDGWVTAAAPVKERDETGFAKA